MSTISIRLPDDLLREIDERAKDLRIARAEYVRKAIECLNTDVLARQRRARLKEASLRVRGESMKVNAEFSEVEDDPES
jgi:metal-responsive CopG/Arc/MetJ family transcriptional regulator